MKYNCPPSARSKHITNSYLEATIEDHKIHTYFSETMMASADNNNAMPPQPLVAPLDVDVTQRFAGGVCNAKPRPKWVTRSTDRGQTAAAGTKARRRRPPGGGNPPGRQRQARPPRGRRQRGRQRPVIAPAPPPPDKGRQERVDAPPHCRLQPEPSDNASPAQPRGVSQWRRPRQVRRHCCFAFNVVVVAVVRGRPGKRPFPTIARLQ